MANLVSPIPVVLFAAVFWLLLAIWAIGGFAAAVLFSVLLDYVLQRIVRAEMSFAEPPKR
ncbi:MAG: hypothetical protein AAFN59_02980 [Pseudomonadota bacterium]